MKNLSNHFFLAIFLALVSQSIQAQFDDIYYDPDKDVVPVNDSYRQAPPTDAPINGIDEHEPAYGEGGYDDETGEWENQDYYYTSRIKRFYRPVYGFDFYDPFYTDYYFYDPYEYNPWFYDRDIYSTSWRFYVRTGPAYWSWNRWSRPYWSYWDWCNGWNSWPYSSWSYYGYAPYNHHWGYGHHHNHYNHGWNDQPRNNVHYGSRHFGLTNTSKRGPVRLTDPSPKVITEANGVNSDNGRTSLNPRRTVRSSDPVDNYHPGKTETRPRSMHPDRNSGLPGVGVPEKSPSSDRSPRYRQEDNRSSDPFTEGGNSSKGSSGWDRIRPHRSERNSENMDRRYPEREKRYPDGNKSQDFRRNETERKSSSNSDGFRFKELFKSDGSSKSNSSDKSSKSDHRDSGRKSPR